MTDRPNVLVLMGGPDAERPVSIVSGEAVAEALRGHGGFRVDTSVIDAPGTDELARLVAASGAEVVFPVLHGTWGEGGALQERLEAIGLPYVGSEPGPSALAMDKQATKRLLHRAGVPTPAAQVVQPGEACRIEPPLVLKPVNDGSSVDLRICRTADAVAAARAELHPRRRRLLAERYIAGRELTVGIVGDETLPIIEIIPAVEFYDYAAKYDRDDTRYVLEPELPAGIAAQCHEIALLAYRRIGCRDLARVDFMLDDRGPWFLELNTMPGFTPHSLVPMAALRMGLDLGALCARLVGYALARKPATEPV